MKEKATYLSDVLQDAKCLSPRERHRLYTELSLVDQEEKGGIVGVVVGISVLLVVLAVWLYFKHSIPIWFPASDHAGKEWEVRGQFGDMFGAFTALFSAFTFGMLIYTIYLQRIELKYQRRDYKMNLAEVRRSADAHVARISLEGKMSRDNLTMRLYDNWHAMDLQTAFHSTKQFFDEMRDNDFPVPSLSELEKQSEIQFGNIIMIIGFAKKWLLLARAEIINNQLMKQLMSIDGPELMERVLLPLSSAEEKNGEYEKLVSFLYGDREYFID